MKKINIDKKKIKKLAKKALPWVIVGSAAVVGGVIVYKKGYFAGAHDGMHKGVELTIKEIADHLAVPNNFAIYNTSSNIPVVFNGVAVHSTEDVEKAVKMIDIVAPVEGDGVFEKSVKQLTDIIFEGKRPIKIVNF